MGMIAAKEVPPALSGEEARQDCLARANVYRLLAGALVEEPGADYLRALRVPENLAMLRELGVTFDADFAEPAPEILQEALACEYTALFVAPGGCPAVESARLTGRFQQEPLYAVRAFYRRAGFALRPGRFAVFDDQLGVELSFVAELLERAAAALADNDLPGYARLDKDIKRFWALHLGRWVRGYSRLLERAAAHSFYREIAKLLRGFAAHELDLLGVRVEDAGGDDPLKTEIPDPVDATEPGCGGCKVAQAHV